ncbi:MAG: S4 domain-containing protein, partial [Chromatiaceae bacterium]|nr:S4 domain-containing protein [Candidatus Thioaporhodococcus sediminis]
MRADQLLLARGLAPSRTAAQRLIETGRVTWQSPQGAQPVSKASQALPDSAEVCVTPDPADRFVSRGGLKLAGALTHSSLDVSGHYCLDVGQSTGGFTDCLLQAGAAQVVGVEVGHGQLHPKQQDHPPVNSQEGINPPHHTPADQGGQKPATGLDHN